MGWSFRRQIKLGPINLNFSRSGIGASAGAGPFRAGVDSKGGQYTNVRGPFGLYSRQYHSTAGQTTAYQSVKTAGSAVIKDSILALVFSIVGMILLFNGAVGPANEKWLILFVLLTGMPAILGFAGHIGHKDATTGWFKAVAGFLSIEKWLLVGLLLVFFAALISSSSKKRR